MNTVRLTVVMTCLALLAGLAAAAGPARLAVDISNQSEPTACAEKDNVSLAFASPDVRSFRIEATHPVYLSSLRRDQQAPDWTACEMTGDPVHAGDGPPGKVVLYREDGFWITGHRHATFWRPANAVVRVGTQAEKSLHLLQVWSRRPGDGRAEEILVLYPQDGYWRARPFSPQGVAPTAYGSSFLIGPVEEAGRPFVDLSEIRFDPKTRTFALQFSRGGAGSLRLVSADRERLVLEAAFDHSIGTGPFAMLRSMYVTEINNDVARIAVLEPDATGWQEANIMSFQRAKAGQVWAGRISVSRHNTSSPDHLFTAFSVVPAAVAK